MLLTYDPCLIILNICQHVLFQRMQFGSRPLSCKPPWHRGQEEAEMLSTWQQQAEATEVLARAEAANVQSDASTSSGPVKAPVMNRICTRQTHFVRNTVYSPRAHCKGNFKAPPPAQDMPRHHHTANFHPHVAPAGFRLGHTWYTGRQVDASELAMLNRWERYHGLGPTLVFRNPPPPRHPPPPLHPPAGLQQVAKASEKRPPLVF